MSRTLPKPSLATPMPTGHGDVKDRRSTSGNVFLLGGGAITWSSSKQSSVALSTVEAEYMALSVATQEAIWLRQLQEELGVTKASPKLINEENQGAISMAKNPVFHKRTKHVQICYHFVREAVEPLNHHPRILSNR